MIKEIAKCSVVYVDRRARSERSVSRGDLPLKSSAEEGVDAEHEEVVRNITSLLSVFNNVSVHLSGSSCLATLSEISNYDPTPTVLLLDVPARHLEDDDSQEVDRHDSGIASSVGEDPLYGRALLRHIRAEMEVETYSQNILTVALISDLEATTKSIDAAGLWTASDEEETLLASKLLDTGAAEAFPSPLTKENTKALSMHCYRLARKALKRRSERKRSWVGVDTDLEVEEQERKNNIRVAEGYAYLREKMVSELMTDIFKPNGPAHTKSESKIRVSPHRHELVRQSVCRWDFSAHEFTDDELLLCAFEMFNHAFTMPEVEEWRISSGQLTDFLFACRRAYNEQVPYHNFRHVVDVLQGVFYFCLALGVLPHFDGKAAPRPKASTTSLSKILRPFDALTLLIVAVGHDVGHPGVNNAFLVTLKAPLAQMYNDKSVLESFHCAAFSQVLRKHWPITQTVPAMRRLMIESILATDMGLHFDYMTQLDKLKQKVKQDKGIKNWDEKTISAHRSLLCTLLIKCADISNVARRYDIAAQWTVILTDEFARQASLETDLKIPTSLAVPPVQGSSIALGKSQVGFMRLFAAPLFQSIADVMPEMSFGIAEVNENMTIWQNLITECSEKGDRPFFLEKIRNSLYYPPAAATNGASTSSDYGDKRVPNGGITITQANGNGEYSAGDARVRKASQAYQEGAPDLLGLGHHDGKSSGSTTPFVTIKNFFSCFPRKFAD
ncbi:3',5'-cyclic-nucleotide phosphodiesterase [Orbilia brochopaga]|uniref:Phosphodiesterase n=1 Tax=Orbilia brochopaga TaxID=3140254 RepID=A0AAV9V6L5_9PEZI